MPAPLEAGPALTPGSLLLTGSRAVAARPLPACAASGSAPVGPTSSSGVSRRYRNQYAVETKIAAPARFPRKAKAQL
jgi:hypothetical protein